MRTVQLCGLAALATLVAAGCGKESSSPSTDNEPSGAEAKPVAVRFGDCAPSTIAFESGPRPQPFDDAMLKQLAALAESEANANTPEPGGSGADPSFDEGKMGKRESTREAGRYAVKKVDAENDALERARKAGLIKKGDNVAVLSGTADFESGLDDGDLLEEMKGGVGLGVAKGQGFGTASGIRGRRSIRPRVRIGNATATGDLDKNIIRRYIRRKVPQVKYCYEKQLLVNPGLQGTVVATFMILPTGSVIQSKASGVSDAVGSCVASVMKTVKFPKPKGGGMVKVSYPFTFDTGDTGASSSGSKAPVSYDAGKDNPLRDQAAPLSACFGKSSQVRHAAMVVDLTVGDTGAVGAAKAHGARDAQVAACVEALAAKVTMASAKGTTMRCALAFGNVSAANATDVVDVTATTTRYRGKDMATHKILLEAVRAQRAQADGPLASTGATVVRIDSAAPLTTLTSVMQTLRTAGAPVLLATREAGEWKLLRSTEMPVVPVPKGTGAGWGVAAAPGARPTVSVLVAADGVWIGDSASDERTQIPRTGDAHDWAAVGKKLTELKASPPYAKRTDLELAGEDAVVYGDVVGGIRAAQGAGFGDWALVNPSAMTVRFRQ